MPRHGRRGKEKSSHGWRVSTVSSSYKNLQSIICTVSWLCSVADTGVYATHRGARKQRPVLLILQHYSLYEVISPNSRGLPAGSVVLPSLHLLCRQPVCRHTRVNSASSHSHPAQTEQNKYFSYSSVFRYS